MRPPKKSCRVDGKSSAFSALLTRPDHFSHHQNACYFLEMQTSSTQELSPICRPTCLELFLPSRSSQDGRAIQCARLKAVYLPQWRDFWSPYAGAGSNPTSDMAF